MLPQDPRGLFSYTTLEQELQEMTPDRERIAEAARLCQVEELLKFYEQFSFTSLKTGVTQMVKQYPTCYIGCLLWGKIDLTSGKERLFEVLASKDGFLAAWAEVNA